jgi:hypothetical protein
MAVLAVVRIQYSNAYCVRKYREQLCSRKGNVPYINTDFLVGSPLRRIRKDRRPNNPRRLRRKRKEVLEGRLKRRFVVG